MYYQFDGLRIYFIAAREICIREQDNFLDAKTSSQSISQLYISYIDEMLIVDERQRCLKSGYYFDCLCKRCLEDLQFNSLKYPLVINSELIECIDLIDEFFHSNYICDLIEYMAQNYNTNNIDIKSLALRKPKEALLMIKKCKQQLSVSHERISKKYRQLICTIASNLIDSSLLIPIDDFFVCNQPNPNEIERIYQLYTKTYYTPRHPRMLHRIWCWIIFILIELWTNQETSLNAALLKVLQTLFRQVIVIRTYLKLNSPSITNNYN